MSLINEERIKESWPTREQVEEQMEVVLKGLNQDGRIEGGVSTTALLVRSSLLGLFVQRRSGQQGT